MKKSKKCSKLGIILAIIAFWIILSSMFRAPQESEYEKHDRIMKEITCQLEEKMGSEITWYYVYGRNDGTIHVEIKAYRKYNGGDMIQFTELDHNGANIQTTTYHNNRLVLDPIIVFP